MKWIIVTIVAFLALGAGVFIFLSTRPKSLPPITPPVEIPALAGPVHSVIGKSVEGRTIDAYAYGSGKKILTFVGGIHGGYEWNSVVLAYDFMDYLKANPSAVPPSESVIVIPSLNPDGVYKVIGKEGRITTSDVPDGSLEAGRFNAHMVDLNRNFDCKWKPESTWQSKTVSGGAEPFSEPESVAFKNFAEKNHPSAVIFWHSQAGAVYASSCEKGILPETLAIVDAYAKASGYPAVKTFDAYAISGAADDWLASIGIPAFSVELKTHATVEWKENLAGAKAILEYYK